MLAYACLRSKNLPKVATRALPLLSRHYSNGSKRPPVFEMRNYEVPPGKLGEVVSSATTRVTLEQEMGSKLLGFWATEGFLKDGLITTEIFALWEYESFDHRDSQLAKRIKNDDWIASVKIMQPLITTKSITLWNHFSFVPLLLEPRTTGGIFEWRNYRLHSGMIPSWQKRFSVTFPKRAKYSSPIGIWFSEIGGLNEIMHIWPYKSMEHRASVRAEASQNQDWAQYVADTMPFMQKMQNKILYPTPLSPIQ